MNEISLLEKSNAAEQKKEAQALSKLSQIQRSIGRNTSASTLTSKLKQADRHQKDAAESKGKQASLSKKMAAKKQELSRYQQRLIKETGREQQKFVSNLLEKENLQAEFNDGIRAELEVYKTMIQATPQSPMFEDSEKYDLFISHASEDKEAFVRPLAEELTRIGVKVWFDEQVFRVGDSISGSIDKGLLNSTFGVTVLSKAFFSKFWTTYEYRGLLTRQSQGHKVVLPIWYEISRDDVIQFSPTLADIFAFNSKNMSVEEIAEALQALVDSE
jgi:hypothetical protein